MKHNNCPKDLPYRARGVAAAWAENARMDGNHQLNCPRPLLLYGRRRGMEYQARAAAHNALAPV